MRLFYKDYATRKKLKFWQNKKVSFNKHYICANNEQNKKEILYRLEGAQKRCF